MAASEVGMLSLDELAERVESDTLDTVLVAFPDLYGRLVGKRLDARFFLEKVATSGTHACNYLLTVDMEMEPVSGYRFANWDQGYGDFLLVPDLSSLRVASWLERSAVVICDVVDENSGNLVSVAPRSLLRRQAERAAAMGYQALAGSELEYYVLDTSYQDAQRRGYLGLAASGDYIEDYQFLPGTREESLHGEARRQLKRSGIPVEGTKGEWGLGQHEINVRYTDILAMADRHALLKMCYKDLAGKLGKSVTFMAKYAEEQAGSSCHLHLSLWNEDGANAFHGDQAMGSARCSEAFGWFLGGWISRVPDFMPFYAPTVNAYKRFRAGSWAPTRLAWSVDNRTASFRVVGYEKSLRIECRLAGADVNPYLLMAASLASGLDGIAQRMEPPPLFEGDAYAAEDVASLPSNLSQAVEQFENSMFVRETLGDEVVEHYAHFYRTEEAAFQQSVTDWERRRYFERI